MGYQASYPTFGVLRRVRWLLWRKLRKVGFVQDALNYIAETNMWSHVGHTKHLAMGHIGDENALVTGRTKYGVIHSGRQRYRKGHRIGQGSPMRLRGSPSVFHLGK